MLYTILDGLTLCMSLLNNTRSEPMVNVAADSDPLTSDISPYYFGYLDAAINLLQVATQRDAERKKRSVTSGKAYDKSGPGSVTLGKAYDESGPDITVDYYETIDTETVDTETILCPKRPMDCEELFLEFGVTTSGIYHIWPRSRIDTNGNAGFDVFCDMVTDGGGWTIFQTRDDFGSNRDLFYKNWHDYKYGFGQLDFDFWLGNDKIVALSNQRRSTLRIELYDFSKGEGFATYDNFYIDDEKQGYRLHIGDYRGNIGDSLCGHNNRMFSTLDRDNDKNLASQCAQLYKGGWWYNNCHTANLNGLYLKGSHDSYANGVNWYKWRGFGYSVKKTEMKLRSSSFPRR